MKKYGRLARASGYHRARSRDSIASQCTTPLKQWAVQVELRILQRSKSLFLPLASVAAPEQIGKMKS